MKNLICSIGLYFIVTSMLLGQAEWRQYQGPYSGNALSFTSNNETIFCGVDLTGIYKSNDNGLTWQTTGIRQGNIVAMHYWDSKVFASFSNAVYVSENNGDEWTQCKGIGWTNLFYTFKNKLFAASERGVFVYDASLNSWTDTGEGLPADDSMGSRNVSAITSVDNTLFCGLLTKGLYKSTDEGQTWEQVLSHSGFEDMWVYHLINFNNKLLLVPHGVERKFYMSEDAGDTWTSVDFIRQDNSFQSLVQLNGELVVFTNKGAYQLNEDAKSFSLFSASIFELAYIHGADLYASNKTGIYKWNGSDFELSNQGINSARVYDIAFYNNALYCATSGGTYFTTDDGETWQVVADAEGNFCYTVEASENKLFVGSGANGIISYSKEDANWQSANNGLASQTIWEIIADNGILYAATDAGLYQSNNEGVSWGHVRNHNSQIINVAAEGELILASQAYDNIYKVSDDKLSLEPIISLYEGLDIITHDGASTNIIYFDDTNSIEAIRIIDGVVYLSIGNAGLFISRDTCKTWERHFIYGVVDVSKRGDENLYATNYGNIYYSPDEGKTWQDQSETGMPNLLINCIFQGEENMYAGTLGNSVYKREYLTDTELYSDEYAVEGSNVTGVSEATSNSELKAGLSCSHGATIVITSNESAGTTKDALKAGVNRSIKIIAEDGKTEKVYTVGKETGIEPADEDAFILYPNPAKDEVFISNVSGEVLQVQVYNLNGSLLLDQSDVIKNVDISSLDKGVYLVKVIGGDNSSIYKIVKE